jgi:hypothetical protein
MNSRFQFHEFKISTISISRIQDFNFTNSRIQFHEFMKLKMCIQEDEMSPPKCTKFFAIFADNLVIVIHSKIKNVKAYFGIYFRA